MIGIIGGSGIYDIKALKDFKEVKLETPFGSPSDSYIVGKIGGVDVAFLPRHGRGHRINPSEINARANVYGFKKLGTTAIISAGAVGSMKEKLKPTDVVIPDQIIDNTKKRESTFFEDGLVAHISFAEPFCKQLSTILYKSVKAKGLSGHNGGTYLCMEGPQFSTKAESKLYRSWNVDVIGMTAIPEAKLAREAEMCYAMMAFITDYDCWKDEHVTVDMITKNLAKNSENMKNIVNEVVKKIPENYKCECHNALKDAIITDKRAVPNDAKKRLDLIVGRYL